MFELIEQGDMASLGAYLIVRMAVVLICWLFVVVANFADFISGVSCAKAIGEHIQSNGYRRTFQKIGDYYLVLVFFLLFDTLGFLFPFYKMPFASILCSVAIIAIECSSVIENSRKKKSHAADVPEKIKEIIECATKEKAAHIIQTVIEQHDKDKETRS